jgi:bisphosphoglycerate-dependent phosphoglycerate mutase
MPTSIYLVRHGATDLTAEERFAGCSDVPLSAGAFSASTCGAIATAWIKAPQH